MLNCDKYFIEALQKAGYDIDYNKLTQIYRASRENPAYIRQKQWNSEASGEVGKMIDEILERYENEP